MTAKTLSLFRWFLRENPEWIPDVRECVVEGERDTAMTTQCALAFTLWRLRTRRGDQEDARRNREQLREQFGI